MVDTEVLYLSGVFPQHNILPGKPLPQGHKLAPGLIGGAQKLALNVVTHYLSLISESETGVCVLSAVNLSPAEFRLLRALYSSFPEYAPYELLLSSLLEMDIEQCRSNLLLAKEQGPEIWEYEMAPLWRSLQRLRKKLEGRFALSIVNLRGQMGYLLISFHVPSEQVTSKSV